MGEVKPFLRNRKSIHVLSCVGLQHIYHPPSNAVRWKGEWVVSNGWSGRGVAFCELCRRLHRDAQPKVYADLRKWMVDEVRPS